MSGVYFRSAYGRCSDELMVAFGITVVLKAIFFRSGRYCCSEEAGSVRSFRKECDHVHCNRETKST